jgi:hypothetical protein
MRRNTRERKGDPRGAVDDYETALHVAPADFPHGGGAPAAKLARP